MTEHSSIEDPWRPVLFQRETKDGLEVATDTGHFSFWVLPWGLQLGTRDFSCQECGRLEDGGVTQRKEGGSGEAGVREGDAGEDTKCLDVSCDGESVG